MGYVVYIHEYKKPNPTITAIAKVKRGTWTSGEAE